MNKVVDLSDWKRIVYNDLDEDEFGWPMVITGTFEVMKFTGEELEALRRHFAATYPPVEDLMKLAENAIEDAEDYAGYASEYFQKKHEIPQRLSELRERLQDIKEQL